MIILTFSRGYARAARSTPGFHMTAFQAWAESDEDFYSGFHSVRPSPSTLQLSIILTFSIDICIT